MEWVYDPNAPVDKGVTLESLFADLGPMADNHKKWWEQSSRQVKVMSVGGNAQGKTTAADIQRLFEEKRKRDELRRTK